MFAERGIRVIVASSVLLAIAAPAAHSQSLLERPPNVSGDWTGAPGTVYFHFLHRFSSSAAPERKVSNVPTFLLATGLPKRILAGLNYSTNSTLAPRFPNEWELFARWQPLTEDQGMPVDLGGQIAYDNAANGVDGEVSVARRFGRARLIAAGRALSDPFEKGNVRFAVGGGAALRLGTYVSLTGDVSTLTNRDSTERVAWSAGLHLAIPLTPHTLSLQATNTLVTTLQGISRGSPDVRYGFEFTIPLTLRRYFGRRAEPPPVVASTTMDADSANRAALADSVAMLRAELTRRSASDTQRLRGDSVGRSAVNDSLRARSAADSARALVIADSVRAKAIADSLRTRAANDSLRTRSATDSARRSAPPARAATPPATARPAVRTVRTGMRNTNYLNTRIEITVGSTVQWTNNDPMPHTVSAVDKSFDSGLVASGKTWQHTFTRPGTYNFYCMPHPFMKGVIVVKAP